MVSAPPILVDTSVLIDHLRGSEEARDALIEGRRSGRNFLGSVLTRTEVLGGMRAAEKAPTRRLLSVIDWVEVSEAIADAAGELAREYRRSHTGTDVVDYVIAATAITRRADLWTRNVKHFPMFPDLMAPY